MASCGCAFGLLNEPTIALWSMKTTRCLPWISVLKWRIACWIASSSLLYTVHFCLSSFICRDQNPRDLQYPLLYYSRTPTTALSDASVVSASGAEGSGWASWHAPISIFLAISKYVCRLFYFQYWTKVILGGSLYVAAAYKGCNIVAGLSPAKFPRQRR